MGKSNCCNPDRIVDSIVNRLKEELMSSVEVTFPEKNTEERAVGTVKIDSARMEHAFNIASSELNRMTRVVDAVFQYKTDNPEATDVELKLHTCKELLCAFKEMTAADLLSHLLSVDLKKGERQIMVTLTFPWEITLENGL